MRQFSSHRHGVLLGDRKLRKFLETVPRFWSAPAASAAGRSSPDRTACPESVEPQHFQRALPRQLPKQFSGQLHPTARPAGSTAGKHELLDAARRRRRSSRRIPKHKASFHNQLHVHIQECLVRISEKYRKMHLHCRKNAPDKKHIRNYG